MELKKGELYTIKEGKKQSNYFTLDKIKLLRFEHHRDYYPVFTIVEGSCYCREDHETYTEGIRIEISEKVVQPKDQLVNYSIF